MDFLKKVVYSRIIWNKTSFLLNLPSDIFFVSQDENKNFQKF